MKNVSLYFPDYNDLNRAQLVVRACRLGSFMTAGREEFTFEVQNGDALTEALQILQDAWPETEDAVARLTFGSEKLTFDCTLWPEILVVLTDFDLAEYFGRPVGEDG